jgi:ATP-dependent DNA helicase UvrD/PcrA
LYAETSLEFDFDTREEKRRRLSQVVSTAAIDLRNALVGFNLEADVHQRRVIDSDEPTIRLIAPAGSGKTQTVVNRVLRQIGEGANPSNMLILTFDNAAKDSLQQKLHAQLKELDARTSARITLNELTISTLNAFGYGLLREHARDEWKRIAKPSQLTWTMQSARADLDMNRPELAARLPDSIQNSLYLELFSWFKNELIDPRNLSSESVQNMYDLLIDRPIFGRFFPPSQTEDQIKVTMSAVANLFIMYDQKLSSSNRMDFDDQKLRSWSLLVSQPELLGFIQGRLDEVVVDEFQDINRLDFEMIKLISEDARLVVTGDDDQAIYGFRGCSPKYIIQLEQHLRRRIVSFELRTNYRCPGNLIRHADRLINHNIMRIPKQPIAHRDDDACIVVESALTTSIEASAIVDFCERIFLEHQTLDLSDIAILYRMNAQSLPLQVELIRRDIPFSVSEEHNILNNEILPRLLAALSVKLNLKNNVQPSVDDQVEFIRAYFRYLRERDRIAVRRILEDSRDFLSCITSPEFAEALLKSKQSKHLDAFEALFRADGLRAELRVLRDRFKGLKDMAAHLDDVVSESGTLSEIFEVAATFRDDTEQFVEQLRGTLEKGRLARAGVDRGGIALSTYHRAKGRQWHTVILTSCNEGIIPHARAMADLIEEERRLFYVGLTRASANLYVSYLAKAFETRVKPSRFLFEAGLLHAR